MLLRRCKIVSFWRFRGYFICRLCHAGSTRAEGGPRRAFPPLIFVGRAASRPVGAACPAAGLPPVRRLYCLGRSLRAGRRRLILLMRASAAFCFFGGHKARSQSQSLASASPQRIIRRHAALSDRPLGCGGDGCGRLLRFTGLTGTKPASARKALHPPRHSESSAAVRPTSPAPGCGCVGCGRLPRFAPSAGTKPALSRKALHPPRLSESSGATRP